MTLIIIGAIAIIIGIAMFFVAKKKKSHVLEMKYVKTSKIKDLFDLHKSLLSDLGPASIKQLVEVKGMLDTDTPLASELAEVPCVAYRYSVEERYEEDYEERDDQGRVTRKTRTGYSTVESNEKRTVCKITDDTGTILCDPNGAPLEMEKSLERYEAANNAGAEFKIGSFIFGTRPLSGSRRILGYRFKEYVFPIKRNIYAIGEMRDRSSEPVLCKPDEKDKPFVLSLKSEEEVIKSTESSANILTALSIIFVLGGAAAIIYYFVQ